MNQKYGRICVSNKTVNENLNFVYTITGINESKH